MTIKDTKTHSSGPVSQRSLSWEALPSRAMYDLKNTTTMLSKRICLMHAHQRNTASLLTIKKQKRRSVLSQMVCYLTLSLCQLLRILTIRRTNRHRHPTHTPAQRIAAEQRRGIGIVPRILVLLLLWKIHPAKCDSLLYILRPFPLSTNPCVRVQSMQTTPDAHDVPMMTVRVNGTLMNTVSQLQMYKPEKYWNQWIGCIPEIYASDTELVFSIFSPTTPNQGQHLLWNTLISNTPLALWSLETIPDRCDLAILTLRTFAPRAWIIWPHTPPEYWNDPDTELKRVIPTNQGDVYVLTQNTPVYLSVEPNGTCNSQSKNVTTEQCHIPTLTSVGLAWVIVTGVAAQTIYLLGLSYGIWFQFRGLGVLATALMNTMQLPFAFLYAQRQDLFGYVTLLSAALFMFCLVLENVIRCTKTGLLYATYLPSKNRWMNTMIAFAYIATVIVLNLSMIGLLPH